MNSLIASVTTFKNLIINNYSLPHRIAPSRMYALVADFFVSVGVNVRTCRYRLQKYIDTTGIQEPYIKVCRDSSIPTVNNLLDGRNCKGEGMTCTLGSGRFHDDNEVNGHMYYHLVQNNSLVHVVPRFLRGVEKSISIVNMLTRKEQEIIPERFGDNFEHAFIARHNRGDNGEYAIKLKDQQQTWYEELKQKTITLTQFLEEFNNAGNKELDLIEEKACALADVQRDLEVTKVQLDIVTVENSELKCELAKMQESIASMMKDIAYLKNVAPMIDL